MSRYLIQRIEQSTNIEVLRRTEIAALGGNGSLASIEVRNADNGERKHLDCAGLFVFIGARPHTEWLDDDFAKDDHGFLITGTAAARDPRLQADREPCGLETTRPGVFATGDVRSGTTKRCAFAVGDGALGVTCVHWYLSQ